MRRAYWWLAMVGLACFAGSQAVFAQEQDDRGERRERRRFDPQEMLKRMDENGNGVLEQNEISERGRRFITEAAGKAGLDPAQPLPIDKLVTGFSTPSSPSPPGTTPPMGTTPAPMTPGVTPPATTETKPSGPTTLAFVSRVPGFGVATSGQIPPGFDVPLDKTTRFQRPLEERFDAAVLKRVDDMLAQYDLNKDGKIDYPGEEGKKATWQNDPKGSDLNNDGKLDREELCKRIAKLMGSRERNNDDSSRSSRGGGDSGDKEASESRAKVRRYAEGLMKQYDENKNGVLEKSEWSKMRGEPGKADLNGDGNVTLDELAERLGSFGSENSSSSSSGDSSSSGSSDSPRRFGSGGGRSRSESGGKDGEKKPLRFLWATERLPKGLPIWFARNDVDADGQVTMAEYSSSWNDTTATEFAKYDLNSDGVITPDECLLAEKDKMAKK
ncbi:MAG TPA: hypothetical protein VL096_01355 [Pirellulaceae bacterium]|nr:hypothetical protein [Pirellulaceae bacterium]